MELLLSSFGVNLCINNYCKYIIELVIRTIVKSFGFYFYIKNQNIKHYLTNV